MRFDIYKKSWGSAILSLSIVSFLIYLATRYNLFQDAPQPNINQISLAGTIPEITNNLTRKYDSLKPSFIRNLEQIISECVNACETVVQQDSFKELLNSTASFDLIIVEVFGSDCFLPLGHRFRAPVVGLLSSVPLPWVNDYLGNPETASYIPSYMMGYGQHMSLWERLSNTIAIILAKILYTYKSRIPSQVNIKFNIFL